MKLQMKQPFAGFLFPLSRNAVSFMRYNSAVCKSVLQVTWNDADEVIFR